MTKGRKKKPKKQKELQGTVRKDRDNPNAPEPSKELPELPPEDNSKAAYFFRQILELINEMGYASKSDTNVMQLAAMRMAEVEDLDETIKEQGKIYVVTNKRGEYVYKARPEVAMRNEAMRHLQSLLAELGLSPSSRSKVIKPSKPEGDDGWGAFGG